ncbi:hypothetical protein ABIE21_003186 [Conyzicola nivalis]|uniref:Uncharacterized protein n=1 Tax=Conyzicola nivalis TaxID=1477021 RepID=A0ABV2QRU2_9MICO
MTTSTIPAHARLATQSVADTTVEDRRTPAHVTRRVLTAPLRIVLLVVSTVAIILVALLQGVAFLAIAGISALGDTPAYRSGSRSDETQHASMAPRLDRS